MTVDEGLELVEQVLAPGRLNKTQELIFRHAWQGLSYKEIAERFGYTLGYIKDTGSELWKQLSVALGEKVTRLNFQAVLKRIVSQRQPKKELFNKQAVESSESYPDKLTISYTESLRPHQDWGEAIDVSEFYNRTTELATLATWIQQDHCRTVTLLGMGGIGKTALSVKLAEQLQAQFDFVIWRSLRSVPYLKDLLTDIISFLSNQQEVELPEGMNSQISCLIKYLRQHRCLLVLDNFESILQSGEYTGRHRKGYEGYGQLVSRISDERHQSCLLLTSREKLREVSLRDGPISPVRSLHLTGLQLSEGHMLLKHKGLAEVESEVDSDQLIVRYGGNPLALTIAVTTIQLLFSGNVTAFLSQGMVIFGDICELFDQQFERLSALEQHVMYWLAMVGEAMTLEDLQADLTPKVPRRKLLEVLVSLRERSLIEAKESKFSQQPVVMEYVTERLVKQFHRDIAA